MIEDTGPLSMEYKYESKPTGLRVCTDIGTNDVDYSTVKKKLTNSNSISSNSSSPDSPFDDPFSKYEHNKYIEDTTISELDESPKYEIKNKCKNFTSLKPVPNANSKPPPTQAMERPLSPGCRIPSHVFVKTKSTAPVEWSSASNDSLFSIQMGDSSFGRDSIFSYNYSNYIQSPKLNITPHKANESKEYETAFETVKCNGKPSLTPCHSTHSDISGSGVNSFAFPILTGNTGKDGTTSAVGSVRIGFEYWSQQLTPIASIKHPSSEPQQPQQPKASPSTCSSWFRCFTCCTPCSK